MPIKYIIKYSGNLDGILESNQQVKAKEIWMKYEL